MDANNWSQFWSLLSKSLVTGYEQNLEETVQELLKTIDSSCKMKKNWYIPTNGAEIPVESCTPQEKQYTAVCTWLLGHLFCLYEREEWSHMHPSCTKAQIDVLVTCSENRYMNRFFFQEYLSCLEDLIKIQESKALLNQGPQLLKRFTPLPLESLTEIKLMPKYILVSSETLLKNLIKYVVEILESLVPYVVHGHEDLIADMWTTLCNLLSITAISVKLKVIRIFSAIVGVVGCNERHVVRNLCCVLKHMVQALPYHSTDGKSSLHTQDLRFAVGHLLNVLISCGDTCQDEMKDRDLLLVLRSLLVAWEFEGVQGAPLQTACCNVVTLLRRIDYGSIDLKSYNFLLRTLQMQEHAVRIFECILLSELVIHIKSLPVFKNSQKTKMMSAKSQVSHTNQQVEISALSLRMWDLLYKQLWDDITSTLKSLQENQSKQGLEQTKNVTGRICAIIQIAVGFDACAFQWKEQYFVTVNFFGKRTSELLSLLKSVLLHLNSPNGSVQGREDFVRLTFTSVSNLMLLPEMTDCSPDDAKFAVSLLSLPWLYKNDVFDLEIDAEAVVMKDMIQSTQERLGEYTFKSNSLKALANVPYGLYPLWRLSLFKIIFTQFTKSQQQENILLAREAIQHVPCLLMDSKQQQWEVLHGVLLPIINSGNADFLTPLSQVFSTIVCVLAGNYVPVGLKSSWDCVTRSLICRTCHKNFCGNHSKTANVGNVLKHDLNEYIDLLTSSISSVRCNMAASLGSLVLHLPSMYQPNILTKWMNYAVDPDHQVRTTFSRMVKFLIFQRGWMEEKEIESENLREEHIPLTQVDRVELSHSRPRLERVLQTLFGYLNSNFSESNRDFAIQNTLLETIVDIGCVPLDCVLLPVIKIVLMSVSHPAFSHPAIAQVYLKQIADAHNTTINKLYLRFQSDICQVLVSLTGMNFHARPSWAKYMDRVLQSFGFKSTVLWLKESFTHIAPSLFVLVIKFNDMNFLHEIINLLETSKECLVKDYFQYVFPYVFLNEDDKTTEKCVELMENLSGSTYEKLLISSFRNLHNEFFLHYSSKRSRVEAGICKLIDVLDGNKANKSKFEVSSTVSDIAEHLDKRFLGVLVYFDSLFESPDSEEGLKIKALESLPEIIRLLGPKYITPVRFKVLSTLRTALRLTHCDFPHLSCRAWEAFIESVELKSLGPLLGTIVVSLLPLLDHYPEKIVGMLRWLVVAHERTLSEYIPDLFFLPNIPVLQDIFKVVERHLKRVKGNSKLDSKFTEYLQHPLRFVLHDNVDIRKHGLQHLLNLLKAEEEKFIHELISTEIVHPNIDKLLNLLVEGCQDPDQEVRLLCVKNLGVLGALDPSHLPHKKPGKDIPHFANVEEDKFGVQALIELSKGYHAARNTRFLDSFAVAIQELMKIYRISSSQSGRKNLWKLFPENVQQIMAPLESSSYYMKSWQQESVWPHPLYGTRYATSLTCWANTWACRLINFIQNCPGKTILIFCIPSLRTDVNCIMFFLPFILLYAVIYGNEDQHKMMSEEISFIIQQGKKKEEANRSHPRTFKEKLQLSPDKLSTLPSTDISDRATHALCAKTVFSLIDFLEKWVGQARKQVDDADNREYPLGRDETIASVERFLALFSKLDLAFGNYGVKEYARALMYLEDFLEEKHDVKEHLGFLGRIYAQMNEPECIKGVLAAQCIQPKPFESVVYHEVMGQHQEALACYELLAKDHSSNAVSLQVNLGMVRCCLSLDQPQTALSIAQGVMSTRPESHRTFLEAQAECFWRMNNFVNLDEVLHNPKLEDSTAWGVSLGRCLIDITHSNKDGLLQHLFLIRSSLSKALSTASLECGSYMQGYSHVVKLHMLHELESASAVIAKLQSHEEDEKSNIQAVQNMVKIWQDRMELVQAVPQVQEQLLCLHRTLLQLATSFVREEHHSLAHVVRKEIGYSWLKSAEVARKAECYQQAYAYLLNAEKFKPKRHFVELAMLHWQKNVQDSALSTLRQGLEEHFPKDCYSKLDPEDIKICAEAKLLVALYNDQSVSVDFDVSVANYNEAIKVYSSSEKSHALLAQYYDRMTLNPQDRSIRTANFQLWAVLSYIKSLRYGCSEIYHSMSRMLTIWLDYGKRIHSDITAMSAVNLQIEQDYPSGENINERKDRLLHMCSTIKDFVSVLPPYMFMVGFSQLLSRIGHPMIEVVKVIRRIIAKLLCSYPQQTLWMFFSVLESSYTVRRKQCSAVLEEEIVKNSKFLMKLVQDFRKLGELLVKLCKNPIQEKVFKTKVSFVVEQLPRLLTDSTFSHIMVPLQTSRTLILPKTDYSSYDSHNPFAEKTPFITGIRDELTVLPSLQKPRKIAFRGSDGCYYEMMCKSKDDLRLDARVMEFSSIVNNYLQKDPSSCSRNLNIRTYSVVPLNEENGLIEWVPNLLGYRQVYHQLFKEAHMKRMQRETRLHSSNKNAPLAEKRKKFLKYLLPLHPPVFRRWFRNNFPDSRSWFEARKSYVHTTAVMSMVGYILGLGDRHGENILLDTTCGDVVHVDFNCLFNKGETFEYPERVPFRLTHNMVSAMGPTGVEGPFRHVCEITLRLLRQKRETLASVLQPFVYDPLVSWSKTRKPSCQDELTNEMAVENVKKINLRLNGLLQTAQKTCTLQLSVEGQTTYLIQEATNIDNLCEMYIGWAAYM